MKNYLKQTLFCTVFISGFLLWGNAMADTHTVSGNCSASAVQTAINSASEGDIIDVTCTGTVTWSTTVTLSGGKTLRGGGVKGSSGTNGTFPLTINGTYDGHDTYDALVKIVNDDSQSLNRLTGFKFQGTGSPQYVVLAEGKGTGSDGKGAFRIDNNFFNNVSYYSRMIMTDGTTGKLTGLVDQNIFYTPGSSNSNYYNIGYQNTFMGTSETCMGFGSYSRPVGFGTDDFVFYEDNYLYNSIFETSDGGGRLVVRHNEFDSNFTSDGQLSALDGHGADTGGHNCIGIVANEFYNNTVSHGIKYTQMVYARGGKWRIFNNAIDYLSGLTINLMDYRIWNPSVLDWKTCSGDFCCPVTPPQCDVEHPGADDFEECYPLLNQIQDTFIWNNLYEGDNIMPSLDEEPAPTYIALNRDYWMPTYGLESALPATCTLNTYYGATDSGKLWKCTSTNNWTLQYTPYTYPHPLRTEATDTVAPASPTGLSVN